ncbi:MAG: hypothetical protein ACE5E4_02040 [Candidatus Binatia bacterium]
MAFYFAKGLQLGGLMVVGYGLFAGIAQSAPLFRELVTAVVGAGLFYAGRMIEPGDG